MEVNEFKRVLEIGLGRAILFLQTHDATPYRDAILNACLHDTRYDFLMESRRSTYLWDVITRTGFQEFYRDPILKALRNLPDPNAKDALQLAGLATYFAEQGDQEARQLVYDHFVAHITSDKCNGFLNRYDLIVLDDVDGFLFAAEWYGRLLPGVSKYCAPHFFPYKDEEWDEDDRAYWDAAIQRAANNPHLAAYVEFERRRREEPSGRRRGKPLSALSYDVLKRKMETTDREYGLEMWGEKASQADLERAAANLLDLGKEDAQKLSEENGVLRQTMFRKYLRIFRERAFPLDPQLLFDLASQARHEPSACDEHGKFTPPTRVIMAALEALANVPHPAVRQLALELIDNRQWIAHAAILFKSNWQGSNWSLFETLTQEALDPDDYHGMGMDIRELFKAHPEPEGSQTLFNLYEYGPCSFCRQSVVEELDSIQAVPAWMREECRYDANLELREWAEGENAAVSE